MAPIEATKVARIAQSEARPVPKPRSRRLISVAVTFALAIGVGALGAWYLKPSPKVQAKPLARFAHHIPPSVSLRNTGRPTIAISPDGKAFVYNTAKGLFTPVPQMPAFVKGVINLRGRVIPSVDLRVKFGLKAEFTERTCIVVVQVKLPSDQTVQMGLIVDSVEEVVTLAANEIEPTPDFGASISTEYLLGMAKVKGQVKTLLDINRVVAPDTVQAIVQSV